jgi:hypothetical protein
LWPPPSQRSTSSPLPLRPSPTSPRWLRSPPSRASPRPRRAAARARPGVP